MDSPQSPDRDNTYPEVEIEVEPNDSPRLDPELSFNRAIATLKEWYIALPVPARVAVAAVGLFITFSAVTTILRLVSAVLSVLVLAGILLLLYRFLREPTPPPDSHSR